MNLTLLPIGFSLLCWLIVPLLLFSKLFLSKTRKETVDVIAFLIVLLSLASLMVFFVLARS